MENPQTNRSVWLIAGTLAAISAAYACFVYLPVQRKIAGLKRELAEKRMMVSESIAVAPALKATTGELEKTRQYNAAWKDCFTAEREMASLLGRLNALVKQSGATTLRFEPRAPVEYAGLHRIPVAIACTGTFAQVATWLERMERLPQRIWVEDLQIKPTGETGGAVECQATLAVFSDNSENSDQAKSPG